MYLCARVIDFTPLYDFNIGFWNCFDCVAFFVFHFITSKLKDKGQGQIM